MIKRQYTNLLKSLRNLDPRSQIFFFIIFVAAVLLHDTYNTELLTGLILIIFTLIFFSGRSLSSYLKRLLAVYPMIFFVSVLLPFSDGGISEQVWKSFAGIKIYQGGFDNFISVNVKMILIYSASFYLTACSSPFRYLKSLERLHLPEWLLAVLTYVHRLFHLLSTEFERLKNAFNSRYQYLSLKKRIKVLSGMTFIYFMRIVDRSDRAYLAMISKGFNGKLPNGHNIKWSVSDNFFVFFIALYFGLLFYVF